MDSVLCGVRAGCCGAVIGNAKSKVSAWSSAESISFDISRLELHGFDIHRLDSSPVNLGRVLKIAHVKGEVHFLGYCFLVVHLSALFWLSGELGMGNLGCVSTDNVNVQGLCCVSNCLVYKLVNYVVNYIISKRTVDDELR